MRRTDIRDPFAVDLVGLDNYVKLVQDPLFRKVTLNTLLYLLLGVPATMGVALAVGRRHQPDRAVRGFFRVGYYLPVVTSIVAVSVVWKFLYRDNGGLFNTVLGWVGIDGPGWLDSTTLALPSLVLMAVWRNFGTLMVIFLAGAADHPAGGRRGRGGRRRHAAGRGSATSRCRCCDPTLLFGAVITGIGYLQFFEEAVRDDQGRPARLHAVGHLLHLRPVRLRQLRLRSRGQLPAVPRRRAPHLGAVPLAEARRRTSDERRECRPKARRPATAAPGAVPRRGSTPSRRRAVPGRRAVRVDAASRASSPRRRCARSADVVARDDHPGQLRPALHQARLPDVLHELRGRRAGRHRRQHGVLLDARLRAGQAGLPRQEGALRDRAGHADDPRRRDVRAALRADDEASACPTRCSA